MVNYDKTVSPVYIRKMKGYIMYPSFYVYILVTYHFNILL